MMKERGGRKKRERRGDSGGGKKEKKKERDRRGERKNTEMTENTTAQSITSITVSSSIQAHHPSNITTADLPLRTTAWKKKQRSKVTDVGDCNYL